MPEINLTQGKTAVVDKEDYELVNAYKWCTYETCKSWYAVTNILIGEGKRTTLRMHRLILGAIPGQEIDHIDHDGLNNRRSNLRLVTHQQNAFNIRNDKTGSSKYKGVSLHEGTRKWRARIYLNGKTAHLGLFTTEEEAAYTYNEAALKEFGKFASLNILKEVV